MNILVLEKYPEIKKEYLNYLDKNNKVFFFADKYNNKDIEVIIIRSKTIVNRELLDKFPKLKYIARVGVGLDKIDIKECENRNIKVLNTPGVNSNAVADLVLAGYLNLSRKLNLGFLGIENRFNYSGEEAFGKSVGIIGFGNIGKKVYKRFKSFGVNHFYIYDPFLKKEEVEENELCEYIDDKNIIFSKSDIISFHIPLLDSTKNFLGEKEFNLLKKEVFIINTSRGGIIDEKELIKFLKSNINSNFYADVWEEEPFNPKKDLLDLSNVLITPHIGAMTKNSEEAMHFFKELI